MMLKIDTQKLHRISAAHNEGLARSVRDRWVRSCEVPVLRRVVDSSLFFYFTAVAILSNTIFVAVVTNEEVQSAFEGYDRQIKPVDQPSWVFVVNCLFLVAVSVELSFRLAPNVLSFWIGNSIGAILSSSSVSCWRSRRLTVLVSATCGFFAS